MLAQAAAQVDLVGFELAASQSPRAGRPLEADVGHPVVAAGVRAAVDAELQPLDRRPKRSSSRRTISCSLVFVSATAKLHSGWPVQAMLEPRSGLASSGKPISAIARNHLVQARLRHAGQDQVLLAGDADVATERLDQIGDLDRLRAGDLAKEDREADVDQAVALLRVDAEVIGLADAGAAAAPASPVGGRALLDHRSAHRSGP